MLCLTFLNFGNIEVWSVELKIKCLHMVYGQGKWRRMVDVAVKTLKPGSMTAEAFLEEAKIMHKLRHRKLVQLMGVCTRGEPMYIITELMVNGSLLEYLQKEGGRTVLVPHIIDMAAQVGCQLKLISFYQSIKQ